MKYQSDKSVSNCTANAHVDLQCYKSVVIDSMYLEFPIFKLSPHSQARASAFGCNMKSPKMENFMFLSPRGDFFDIFPLHERHFSPRLQTNSAIWNKTRTFSLYWILILRAMPHSRVGSESFLQFHILRHVWQFHVFFLHFSSTSRERCFNNRSTGTGQFCKFHFRSPIEPIDWNEVKFSIFHDIILQARVDWDFETMRQIMTIEFQFPEEISQFKTEIVMATSTATEQKSTIKYLRKSQRCWDVLTLS